MNAPLRWYMSAFCDQGPSIPFEKWVPSEHDAMDPLGQLQVLTASAISLAMEGTVGIPTVSSVATVFPGTATVSLALLDCQSAITQP